MSTLFWPFGRSESRDLTLLWRGRDSVLFMKLVEALRQGGIPFQRTRARGFESTPPSLHRGAFFSLPVLKIEVRPADESRAREIIREVVEGTPPA